MEPVVVAEGGASGMESIISALSSAFGTMATDALGGIATILPVVLPVMAAIITIGIIVKVVKKFVK